MKLPLDGLTVIDLTTAVAAPTAGRLLAVYGADVIKIETPPMGDLLRNMSKGHQLPSEEHNSPLFDVYNSGKRIISLNLKSEKGMEAFHRLLEKADIFISNVRMRSLRKMKIDPDSLSEKYPRLIYGHFSGFGLEGADAERPGFDVTAFWPPSGGLLGWKTPESFVMRPSFGFGDIASGGYFLSGVLMALYARERTGKGSLVSTSLLASGIWCNSTSVINAQPQYGKEYPVPRYQPWDPFSDFFECKGSGWISIAGKNYDQNKEYYAKLYDMPELLADPRYEDLITIRESGELESLTKRIVGKMQEKTAEEWAKICEENDVPYSILKNFDEVYLDEQAWANSAFENVDYGDGVVTAMPMPPIVMPGAEPVGYKPLGSVGEHTNEVLSGIGYSPEEIESMRAEKAIL
jgi:crotonobetainyl-CoA:carnitine CoA-transferase CaiB-like acyl-CoA transferase